MQRNIDSTNGDGLEAGLCVFWPIAAVTMSIRGNLFTDADAVQVSGYFCFKQKWRWFW